MIDGKIVDKKRTLKIRTLEEHYKYYETRDLIRKKLLRKRERLKCIKE